MDNAIPDSFAVHLIYRLKADSAEKEIVGWLTKETGGFVCIQNDRTLETVEASAGSGKGTSIPVSWIQEICVLEKGEKIDPASLFNHSLP